MRWRALPWILLALAALGLLARALDMPEPTHAPDEAAPLDPAASPAPAPSLAPHVRPADMAPAVSGEEDAREEAAHAWVRVEGRVIDLHRRPVPGARVQLLRAGIPLATTTADAQGRFHLVHDLGPGESTVTGRFAVGAAPLLFRATAPDGAVGTRPAFLAPAGVERTWPTQPIQVARAHTLTVLVRSGGAPQAGARVRLAHRGTDRSAQPAWVATGATGADGRWTSPPCPPGTASAWVDGPALALSVATSALPREDPGPLLVDLAAPSSLRVRVVEAGSAAPVPDATILMSVGPPLPAVTEPALSTFPCGRTDAQGVCTVARPAPDLRVFLRASAAGRPRRWMAQRDNVEVAADADEVVLEVLAPTALRWALAAGEGDLPEDGTPVRILDARTASEAEGYALPESGRIEAGHLVVPNAVPSAYVDLALLAVLPDGRAAHAQMSKGESEGEPVHFVTPRRLRVGVRDAQGEPLEGVGVTTIGQPQELRNAVRTFTGRDGTCTLEPLLPLRTTVQIHGAFQTLERMKQTVDLEAGDGTAEFILPAARTLRVLVRVDGRPALPEEWTIVLGEMTHVAAWLVDEDPDRGEILVHVHAPHDLAGTPARFEAPGLPSVHARVEASEDGSRVAFDLSSGGGLVVTVRPPQDGRYQLRLEGHVPDAGGWTDWALSTPPTVREHVWSFGPLEARRWRVRDVLSGLVSEAVELDPAGGPQQVALDLSRAFDVVGRVETPSGTDLSWVRVLRAGDAADLVGPPPVLVVGPGRPAPAPFEEPPGGLRVADDGTFTVRAGGREPVEIRAWHPLLGTSASATVRGPTSEVVLRLAAAGSVHLLFAPPDPDAPAPGARRAVLLRGGVEVFAARPVRERGGVRFGGFAAGTYDLWVDGGARAPLWLPGVELGAGVTTIPDARFPLGATLRVEVRRKQGEAERFLGVTAQHLGVPSYTRHTILGPGHDPVLGGLGPGRFSVTVREVLGAARVLAEREIESDGAGEVTIVIE